MSLQAFIKKSLDSAISKHLHHIDGYELAIPKNNHGDFALNIAFRLAKSYKKAPNIIAEEIQLSLAECELVTSQTAGGYVNLFIKNDHLFNYFTTFLNEEINVEQSGKTLLEYVSANPTGPLHIGHGRWAVIGDSIYRLLKRLGHSIDREFYINDAGNQIRLFKNSVSAIQNNDPVPEDGYGGYFVKLIADKNLDDSKIIDEVINYQKETLQSINCSFEFWFKETELHKSNILEKITTEFEQYIYEKDNALWFRTTDFGDDKDRVVKKENGDLTYFAADIVYHLNKINRGYSSLLNIWGADHHGYIKRIASVIEAQQQPIDFQVILGQLVHLFKDGEPVKMSKRTGELVELAEVIEEIGADATRYFLLEKKPDHQLDFDLTIAKEKSMNNPVYYIKYAHARIANIKSKINNETNVDLPLNDKDRELMMIGSRYYDILIDAGALKEPYKLCVYLMELAKVFHSFYKQNHIIKDNQIHQKRYQIVLVTQKIIQDCCAILGISTPNKM